MPTCSTLNRCGPPSERGAGQTLLRALVHAEAGRAVACPRLLAAVRVGAPPERIAMLMNAGAIFNVRDRRGLTALMVAARYGCEDMARTLLSTRLPRHFRPALLQVMLGPAWRV